MSQDSKVISPFPPPTSTPRAYGTELPPGMTQADLDFMLGKAQEIHELAAGGTLSQPPGFQAVSPEAALPAADVSPPQVPEGPGTLSAEELQHLREMILEDQRRRAGGENYQPPDIPVSDDEKARFFDSIANRRAYSEEMVIIPDKLQVVLRCQTRREIEFVSAQLTQDMRQNLITSEVGYARTKINYDLMMQMMQFNGAPVDHPSSSMSSPQFSLRTHLDRHLLRDMPEPTMFMLSGALAQFERRVRQVSRECLDKNFTRPVAV